MLRSLSRLVLATAVAAGACGGTPSQPSVAAPAVYATEHFVFRHGPDDAPQIARTAAALEALGAASMPSVTVTSIVRTPPWWPAPGLRQDRFRPGRPAW